MTTLNLIATIVLFICSGIIGHRAGKAGDYYILTAYIFSVLALELIHGKL